MDQVCPNQELRLAIGQCADTVGIPDFLKEAARLHDGSNRLRRIASGALQESTRRHVCTLLNAQKHCPATEGRSDCNDPLFAVFAVPGVVSLASRSNPVHEMDTSADSVNPLQGMEVGGCIVEAEIGTGATGAVYRARQISLDRPVAIKILHPHVALHEVIVNRFAREARAAARLKHPNVVQIYDFGQSGDLYYYTMELVQGPSLGDALRDGRIFPESECVNICRQALAGLSAAHALGIVHRDLKPDNMLLGHDGMLRISDLGLAQIVERDHTLSSLTMTGDSLGTPYYMSPEQVRDARTVDHRSDYYSLGASLFHLATGVPPYDGNSRFDVMSQHVSAPVPQAREQRADMTVTFSLMLSRLMAKDPDLRPASPEQLEQLMDACERAQHSGIELFPSSEDGPDVGATETTENAVADDAIPSAPPSGGVMPWRAVAIGALLLTAAFAASRLANPNHSPQGLQGSSIGAANAASRPDGVEASRMALQALAQQVEAGELSDAWDPGMGSDVATGVHSQWSPTHTHPDLKTLQHAVWSTGLMPTLPGAVQMAFAEAALPPFAHGTMSQTPGAASLSAVSQGQSVNGGPANFTTTELFQLRNLARERATSAFRQRMEVLPIFLAVPPEVRVAPWTEDQSLVLAEDRIVALRMAWTQPPLPPALADVIEKASRTGNLTATLNVAFSEVTAPGRIRLDIEPIAGGGALPARTVASSPVEAGRSVLVSLDVTSTVTYQFFRGMTEDYVLAYEGPGKAWIATGTELPREASPELELVVPRTGIGLRERLIELRGRQR